MKMIDLTGIVDALVGASPSGLFQLGAGLDADGATPDATTFDLGAGVAPAPRRPKREASKRAKRGLAKLRKALS